MIGLSFKGLMALPRGPMFDPSFANVSLLMHFDGTDGGTTFTDVKGNTITRNGAVVTSATKAKWGTSGSFGSSSDYLTTPQTTAFDFGTGDFTVEVWHNPSSTASSHFVGLGSGAVVGSQYTAWSLRYDNAKGLMWYRYDGAETEYDFATSLATNTWHHIAVTRSGTNLRMFLNGIQVGTTQTSSVAFTHVNTDPLYIGHMSTGAGALSLNGYIDDLRITKGVARYTANFSPPVAPFPNS